MPRLPPDRRGVRRAILVGPVRHLGRRHRLQFSFRQGPQRLAASSCRRRARRMASRRYRAGAGGRGPAGVVRRDPRGAGRRSAWSRRPSCSAIPCSSPARSSTAKSAAARSAIPTANLRLDPACGLKHGIYAVRVGIGRQRYDGVASFGRRPTFDNGAPLLEIFLFDFAGDLYGAELDVAFIAWIRPERNSTGSRR